MRHNSYKVSGGGVGERCYTFFSLGSHGMKLSHGGLRIKQGHFKKCKNLLLLLVGFCFLLFEFWNVPSVYCLGLDTLYGQPKSATETTFTKAFLPGCA